MRVESLLKLFARKFKTRSAPLGFSDKADLNEGSMWATDFALTEMTADEEAKPRQ
ncbi:hypothetical protein PQR72_11640 [Paraburkholderia madseniana]|jgi:hypothetical protein|uniref:hypothetical protein n=1 Tax=Paraburkholderia madseniana TaxID=2599607 RepID=UPI0015C55C04|nr:hypothetical protein [Paraburkholderia madseniana]NPT64334.1 hypothetical protein [Paraburkholderia madseniana]